jgi:hypothetical protein
LGRFLVARSAKVGSGRYSGDPEKLNVAVFGSEEECIEDLAKVVAEGIDMLMVNPLYDFEEQVERLAKDVLPKLL